MRSGVACMPYLTLLCFDLLRLCKFVRFRVHKTNSLLLLENRLYLRTAGIEPEA